MFRRLTFLFIFLFLQFNIFAEKNQSMIEISPIEVETTKSIFSQHYKKLKYEASLAYTKYSAKDIWWSQIAPFNLYLGALPLKNEGHFEEICKLGVTKVLSLVEDFEVEDGWFNNPVKKEDWESNGIEVMHIGAVDFRPLKIEEIDRGVDYLAKMLENGEVVYVHCKAGRGRSATIVIVYLMKFHNLSFDEAYQFVKDQRPHINLNVQQRNVIFEYFGMDIPKKQTVSTHIYTLFNNMNEISAEKFSVLLQYMLTYVIEGIKSDELSPTWLPSIEVQSTLQRRNRYLREYQGDQKAAVQAAIARNHGFMRKLKIIAPKMIPFVGTPAHYSLSLWHQMREVTLIAALYGHDVNDPAVQMKILACLVGGDILKLPAYSIDVIARKIVMKIAYEFGFNHITGSMLIPTNLIFNYFTDNSAHVATHAIDIFGNENAFSISPEEYWILETKVLEPVNNE